MIPSLLSLLEQQHVLQISPFLDNFFCSSANWLFLRAALKVQERSRLLLFLSRALPRVWLSPALITSSWRGEVEAVLLLPAMLLPLLALQLLKVVLIWIRVVSDHVLVILVVIEGEIWRDKGIGGAHIHAWLTAWTYHNPGLWVGPLIKFLLLPC